MIAIGYFLNRDFMCLCSPKQKGSREGGTCETQLLIHKSFIVTHSSKIDDGFNVWMQLLKEGYGFLVISISGPHTLCKRADLWNRLQILFPPKNILLYGYWNMMDLPEDSSKEQQVVSGAKDTALSQFCVKYNLMDLWLMAAEAKVSTHTRWSFYIGASRWSIIDWFYVSHGERWLTSAQHVLHHAGNTLFDHLSISTVLEIGTIQSIDSIIALRVFKTFKWNTTLLIKEAI